jgi:hypothetical protein
VVNELIGKRTERNAAAKIGSLYAAGFSDALSLLRKNPHEAASLAQEFAEHEAGVDVHDDEDFLESLLPKVH